MTNDPWKSYRPEEPWKTLEKILETSIEIPFNPGELSKIPLEKKKNQNRIYATHYLLYPMRSHNHLMQYLFPVWPLSSNRVATVT